MDTKATLEGIYETLVDFRRRFDLLDGSRDSIFEDRMDVRFDSLARMIQNAIVAGDFAQD